MNTVAEIESAIERLSSNDQNQIRKWLLDRPAAKPSIFEQLKTIAATAGDLPEDLATNHDHYLHGTPKRSEQ
jgi:hypothetical protein